MFLASDLIEFVLQALDKLSWDWQSLGLVFGHCKCSCLLSCHFGAYMHPPLAHVMCVARYAGNSAIAVCLSPAGSSPAVELHLLSVRSLTEPKVHVQGFGYKQARVQAVRCCGCKCIVFKCQSVLSDTLTTPCGMAVCACAFCKP